MAPTPIDSRALMVHPHTELRFINPLIGYGVFATRPIPRGTIVWTLDALDQRFDHADAAALPDYARRLLDAFGRSDGAGRHLLCWDHARFVNHSCEANCLALGYDFELAVRDIPAGEELCADYGARHPARPFPCACDAPACREEVRPDDPLRLGERWHETARAAFFEIPHVPQPLWSVLPEKSAVEAALADPARLRPLRRRACAAVLEPA